MELVWTVGGGRPLSFNHNASVGAPRRNSEHDDIIAILMRIENPEENGYAVRVSVLTVGAQPQATEMLSVECYNGFDTTMIWYLPRTAGILVITSLTTVSALLCSKSVRHLDQRGLP